MCVAFLANLKAQEDVDSLAINDVIIESNFGDTTDGMVADSTLMKIHSPKKPLFYLLLFLELGRFIIKNIGRFL